jgi:hypothetical protein
MKTAPVISPTTIKTPKIPSIHFQILLIARLLCFYYEAIVAHEAKRRINSLCSFRKGRARAKGQGLLEFGGMAREIRGPAAQDEDPDSAHRRLDLADRS